MTITRDQGSGVLRPAAPVARGSLVCLLATLHAERGLSRLLAEHLLQELPHVAFTLRDDVPSIHTVWLCGYEPGRADAVRSLRERHPGARLVVSARHPMASWSEEALRAGADAVCQWPVSFGRLDQILHGGA